MTTDSGYSENCLCEGGWDKDDVYSHLRLPASIEDEDYSSSLLPGGIEKPKQSHLKSDKSTEFFCSKSTEAVFGCSGKVIYSLPVDEIMEVKKGTTEVADNTKDAPFDTMEDAAKATVEAAEAIDTKEETIETVKVPIDIKKGATEAVEIPIGSFAHIVIKVTESEGIEEHVTAKVSRPPALIQWRSIRSRMNRNSMANQGASCHTPTNN
jgi:hypothetical protein